jgi:YHS domain-containing protein
MNTAMKDIGRDPVCGMDVPEGGKHAVELNGVMYSFCSAGCLAKFNANQIKYVSAANTQPKVVLAHVYTCPMHPEVQREVPGSCTKCGMGLVAAGTPIGGRITRVQHNELRNGAILWGLSGGVALVAVYFLILVFANSTEHALSELRRLWYWMIPLISGFAVQLALFAYARGATRSGTTASSSGVIATGGVSTLSMVACCAHHLTDVLPLIGLAGAALFLADYQTLFLLLGFLSNIVGIVYMLGTLRRHGLYPETRGLLALFMRWPVERAFIPTALISASMFVAAVIAVLK